MEDISNADRAQWALAAITDFIELTRVDTAYDAIHDLIADLLHLARMRGLNTAKLVSSAKRTMALEHREDAEGDMDGVQHKFYDLLPSDD